MWKMEQEEQYFRILDPKKNIAGYFDPDYGRVPKEKEQEIIEEMLKNRHSIPGGYLMVGLAKFGIFGGEYRSDVAGLERQLDSVMLRISRWKELMAEQNIGAHSINVSHTDQDMLTVTFPVRFALPVPLEGGRILAQIRPLLDLLQRRRLL